VKNFSQLYQIIPQDVKVGFTWLVGLFKVSFNYGRKFFKTFVFFIFSYNACLRFGCEEWAHFSLSFDLAAYFLTDTPRELSPGIVRGPNASRAQLLYVS